MVILVWTTKGSIGPRGKDTSRDKRHEKEREKREREREKRESQKRTRVREKQLNIEVKQKRFSTLY